MALQSAIPVSFEAFFPRGAFVVGEVEPVVKWSDDGQRQGQDLDKISGQPLWQVRVIDADPDAKKALDRPQTGPNSMPRASNRTALAQCTGALLAQRSVGVALAATRKTPLTRAKQNPRG